MSISRTRMFAVFALLALSNANGGTVGNNPVVAAPTLPMMIIWYSFGTAYGQSLVSGDRQSDLLRRLGESLESSLSGLKADIPTKLAFVANAVTVATDVVGSRAVGRLGVNTMYVIGGARDNAHRIVVIVSNSDPENTTIFTLDDHLKSSLVYDSTAANRYAGNKHCNPMGQIIGASVELAGVIYLDERNRRWSADRSRTFVLDTRLASPALSCGAASLE